MCVLWFCVRADNTMSEIPWTPIIAFSIAPMMAIYGWPYAPGVAIMFSFPLIWAVVYLLLEWADGGGALRLNSVLAHFGASLFFVGGMGATVVQLSWTNSLGLSLMAIVYAVISLPDGPIGRRVLN